MIEELKLLTNEEIESILLSEILYKGDVFDDINEEIKSEYFSNYFFGEIFAACVKLANVNIQIDPLILINHFASDEKSEVFKNIILELSQNFSNLASGISYAKIISELYKRRELLKKTKNFQLQLSDLRTVGDIKELVINHEKSLFSILNDETGSELKSISSLVKDKRDLIRKYLENPDVDTSLNTDFIDFDRMIGDLSPSDLIIVAGRPSMGKTAFVTNLATNIALAKKKSINRKGNVLFFSLEMSSSQIASRIITTRSNIDHVNLKSNKLSKEETLEIERVETELDLMPFYVDDSGMITVQSIITKAKRAREIHGVDIIIIDYLQLIKSNGKASDNRVNEISEITRSLKQLAKEMNVPVIALSQLSRAVEQRECKRPLLSDLRESGSIEQDADIVIFVYREEYYLSRSEPSMNDAKKYTEWKNKLNICRGKAELVVAKNRHGKTGIVYLNFDENKIRFR